MCETLASLIEVDPTAEVVFSGSYDPQYETDTSPQAISLAEPALPILRAAASQLKSEKELGEQTIDGPIYQLKHERGGQRLVRLEWRYGVDVYKVEVALSEADYATALAAHGADKSVSVRGRLERSGRNWKLLGARDLTVLDDQSRVPLLPAAL